MEKAAAYMAEQVRRAPADLVLLAERAVKPLTSGGARSVLLQAIEPALQSRVGAVTVRVIPDKAFLDAYSSSAGEAVTLVTKDAKGGVAIEVVVKQTATPRGIADEAVHVEQALDPVNAERMAGLTAATKDWATLSLPKQLQVYADKLEIEADAARRTLKTLTDEDEIADYRETLTALEERLGQVRGALAESDPEKMLAKVPGFDPKQPPMLFAKARLPLTDGHWVGPRGNGLWYSDKPEVIAVTGKGVRIPYRNNYPVFSRWAKAIVGIDFSQGAHFAQADAAFARQLERAGRRAEFPEFFTSRGQPLARGECHLSAVEEWRVKNALTWHHHQGPGQQMLLLPRSLHANVTDTGGHAISQGTPHSL